jgi:hypothetical protein
MQAPGYNTWMEFLEHWEPVAESRAPRTGKWA